MTYLPFRIKKISQYSDSQIIAAAYCLCEYAAITNRYMNYANMLCVVLSLRMLLGIKKYRTSPLAFCWAMFILAYPILDALIRGGVGLPLFEFLCYLAPLTLFLNGNIDIEEFCKTFIAFVKGFAFFQVFGIFLQDISLSAFYMVASKILAAIPSEPCGFTTSNTMTAYIISVGLGAYLIDLSLIKEENQRQRLVLIVKVIILFAGLVITNKRSFLIATVGGFMIIMILNNLKAPRNLVYTFVLLFVSCASVYMLSMYFVSIGSTNAFGRLGQTFIDVSEGEDISNMRWQWEIYMNEWSEGHEIFGIGWESFRKFIFNTPYGGKVPNGHNVYLQIKSEEGYVGYVVYITLIASAILTGAVNVVSMIGKNKFVTKMSMWSLYVVIVYTIYCNTGNAIYDSMIYLYFFCAVYITSEINKRLFLYDNRDRLQSTA